MSKKARTAARSRRSKKRTNPLPIFLATAGGALLLFGLLYLALRQPAAPDLADYCRQNPASCVVSGDENAPITVVEVSDYGCTHCRDFNLETAPLIEEQYLATGQIRWVTMPFALSARTLPAAEAALCAADQGKFADFHHTLFQLQGDPASQSREWLMQAASQVGLELEQFSSCFDQGKYQSALQANLRAAQGAGVNATPTFFINGVKLEGAQPFTVFQQQFAQASGS